MNKYMIINIIKYFRFKNKSSFEIIFATLGMFVILILSIESNIHAQSSDLQIFSLIKYVKSSGDTVGFVSLSDIYSMSESPDSVPMPLINIGTDDRTQYPDFILLDSIYRLDFFKRTGINEKHKIYIFSYSLNRLISCSLSHLPLVAFLNIYGAEQPYSANEYMIGFEIKLNYFKEFDIENSFVAIHSKNPFAGKSLQKIHWIQDSITKSKPLKSTDYDTLYAGISEPFAAFVYSNGSYDFYIQDYKRRTDNFHSIRRLQVFNRNSGSIVFEKNYYAGESAVFAEPGYQWTGLLFKNKPPVLLGILWHSFGCPEITVLQQGKNPIPIFCDNRH